MQWLEKRPKSLDANIAAKNGGYFVRVKLHLPSGELFERKGTAATKTGARKLRDDLYAAFNELALDILARPGLSAVPLEKAPVKMTLRELAEKCRDEWWPARGRSVDIAEQFFQKIRDYVYPVLGEEFLITALEPDHWDRIYQHLLAVRIRVDEPLSDATIRKVKATLSSALSCAVSHKRLGVNPIKGLTYTPNPLTEADRLGKSTEELPDEELPAKRMLTDAEVTTMLEKAAHTPLYPLLVLQVAFGLRIAEALAVKWGDFAWTEEELRVRFQVKRRRNAQWKPESKEPKTVLERVRLLKSRSGRRDIHLFPDTLALLKGLPRGLDGTFLVSSETGGPMDPQNAQRLFRALMAELELPPSARPFRGLTIRWSKIRPATSRGGSEPSGAIPKPWSLPPLKRSGRLTTFAVRRDDSAFPKFFCPVQ